MDRIAQSGRAAGRDVCGGIGAVALALSLIAMPLPVGAQTMETEERTAFEIAPQNLGDALVAFTRQTGIQFFVDGRRARGVTSPGARGLLSPPEALSEILAGTGLNFDLRDAETITIRPITRTDAILDTVPQPVRWAQATDVELSELSVEGQHLERGPNNPGDNVALSQDSAATSGGGGGPSGVVGYTTKISPTATKTNTPLIETPQSVTVVTREQLNDRGVQSVTAALAYAPGASTEIFGFNPRFDAFYIRGFPATFNGVYRDGLRRVAVGVAVPSIEAYGTEAITILRGPSAGLYGLGSPGGIVDATTKRPVFTRFGEAVFQAGNYDRFQGSFDLGGPVEGSDGTLAYRLTGVVRQSDTYLPGPTDDRINIAPAFTWKPSADTTFTLLTEFQSTKLPSVATFYNFPGFVTSRLFEGDSGFNTYAQQQYRVGYAFEHRFSPDLIFRQNFRYENVHSDYSFTSITGIRGLSASRYAALVIDDLSYAAVDNQLEAHFATGPVAHTVLGGIDYLHYDYQRRLGTNFNVPNLNLTGVRDFANFRYRTFIPRPALTSGSLQTQDQVGVYLQEQAKWDRFVLTLTGRQDFVQQTTQPVAGGVPGTLRPQNDSAFTGRVGLNYILAPGLVPYASYATTFTTQVGIDARGQPFKPATGDQIEAGVKYALPGTNITAAFAGFDIVQSSILRQDPLNIASQVATGAVRSTGFEAELAANFGPGTNVTLSYTHLDFRFLRQTSSVTNAPIDGNALSGVPGNSFKAFATYLFPPSSSLAGLQVGGGVRYAGTSFADDDNTVRNATVALFDAMIAYDLAALDPRYKGFRAQINAFNVFDRDFVNCQAGFCFRGAPATVIGSLMYRW